MKSILNLVPEYNSDNSDDDNSKQTNRKTLFPSSSRIDKSSSKAEKSQAKNSKPNSPNEKNSEFLLKTKTFASIITGGRSPQHETAISQYGIEEIDNEAAVPKESCASEPENISQKTFQRKRRIEFNVSHTNAKRIHPNEESVGDSEKEESTSSIRSSVNKYNNFQKGETEFIDKQSPDIPSSETTTSDDNNLGKRNDDIKAEQLLLQSKLNFLCQGREEVSPVQIIQIQLQVRQHSYLFFHFSSILSDHFYLNRFCKQLLWPKHYIPTISWNG